MEVDYRGYLVYVLRHKWHVFCECLRAGIPWRGLLHDLSKVRPSELPAYAAYFYGGHERGEVPADVQAAFDRAWLLHQKRNDHHWQFWLLREDSGATKALPMSDLAMREMLADWRGAGRAILGDKADTAAWYRKNAANILLHDDTRSWIERELGI